MSTHARVTTPVNRSPLHTARFAPGIAAAACGLLTLAGCPEAQPVADLLDAAATAITEQQPGTAGAADSAAQDDSVGSPSSTAGDQPGSSHDSPVADDGDRAGSDAGDAHDPGQSDNGSPDGRVDSPSSSGDESTGSNDPPPQLAGSCAQGVLYGDINGAEATAIVEVSTLTQVMGEAAGTIYSGATYVVFAGEIHSGPYAYIFSADIFGSSGYGDMVSYADGSSFRIRVDLYPDGFLLATGVFESDCGAAGCGQYVFTCR